jgi:hypothetical protein
MILAFQISLLSATMLFSYLSIHCCCKRHHCKLCDGLDESKEEPQVLRRSKRLQEKQENSRGIL